MTTRKNFVFSQQPQEYLENNEENPAYDLHQPTPAFTGNKIFKSGDKKGSQTPAYKKWIKDNMNKPDFNMNK